MPSNKLLKDAVVGEVVSLPRVRDLDACAPAGDVNWP